MAPRPARRHPAGSFAPDAFPLRAVALRVHALALLAALASGACATPRQYRAYPTPFSAVQLAQENSGEALVWYLRQRDATPAVCDVASRGPHVALTSAEDMQDLVDGLARGLDPATFRACVDSLIPRMTPAFAAEFFDQMGRAYRALLRNERLEQDPALRAQLDALHRVYVDRPPGFGPHPDVMRQLADELRGAMLARRLGPVARRYGDDLLGTLDLEQGRWANQTVGPSMLDRLQRERNAPLLQRFARRLPTEPLRREATRRIVRLRIASSDFSEVRDHPDEVERVVMERGRYPIPTARYRPRAATLDALRVPARAVLVRQDVYGQSAALLSFLNDPADVSVLPELPFRGGLRFELEGVSRPVTLCGPRSEFDPTPCVLASEVRIDNPLAYLEEDGAFRLRDRIGPDDVLALAARGERFDMPIRVGDQALLTVTWRLRFERPQDLVLAGAEAGGPGPNLRVDVDARTPGRLVYRVTADRQYVAVVEATDAAEFGVYSRGGRGAQGFPGAPGADGQRGYDGQGASCPSGSATGGGAGGPGGDGTDGGPGGPGGQGGEVIVDAHCPANLCGSLALMLQRNVQSLGGDGGAGGAGGAAGRGGYGGRGGAGTYCSSSSSSGSSSGYSLPSGPDGPRGPDGRPGVDGPPGPAGPPGHVALRVVPGV